MSKVTKQQAVFHERAGVSASYYQLPQTNGGTTVAYAEFTGEHGKRTIGERARIYYVLDGEAEFIINNEKIVAASGDTVAIPAHATYNLWPTSPVVKVLLVMELLDTAKLQK